MGIIEIFKMLGRCINRPVGEGLFPPVICKDGFYMSIQASENHICIPRENLDTFEYDCVEVYCSENTDEFKLCRGDGQCTYFNVPVQMVDNIINKHQGIDLDEIKRSINDN